MGIVSLLFRVLILASQIMKTQVQGTPLNRNIGISCTVILGLEVIFAILSWKKQEILSKHFAPVFLLCQLGYVCFIPVRDMAAFAIFAFTFSFYMVFGILLSHTWLYTSIFLIINGVGSVSIIIGINGIYELSTMVMLATALALLIYVSYSQEKSLKNQVLQLHQIQNMNDELSTLFNNLPEGIILYDPITMKISLVNEEFKRLFNIQESQQNSPDSSLKQSIHVQNQNDYKIENYSTCRNIVGQQLIDASLLNFNITNNAQQEIQYSPFKSNDTSLFIEDESQNQLEKCLYVPRLLLFKFGQQQENQESLNSREDQVLNILQASKINENDGPQQYFKILTDPSVASQKSIEQSLIQQQPEYLTIKESKLSFKGKVHKMILTKNITTMINYENIKVENFFYEMLTATVSHDMRTPLNAIQGLLKNLELFIIDPRGKKFLQIIQNSSSFLNYLVNDLLDFFQIKNGKFRINNTTVDLKTTFQNLVDMFSVGANEKGLQVVFSSIYISLYYEEEEKQIKVSVADTGVGIKQEDQEKLFKLFGKLEQTSNINTSGIGLGLGICKNLVEMLGGKIIIENDYQNGAKFTFTIKCEVISDSFEDQRSNFVNESEDCYKPKKLQSRHLRRRLTNKYQRIQQQYLRHKQSKKHLQNLKFQSQKQKQLKYKKLIGSSC
eukprot:403369304